MKKIVYSTVVFALLSGTAFAISKEKMFEKMDADNNGKATPKEFVDFWGQWFTRKDKNKDGALEFEEFSNSSLINAMDKNKNDKIEVAEHDAYRKRQFKQYDANKDGHLTVEEFTAEKKWICARLAAAGGYRSQARVNAITHHCMWLPGWELEKETGTYAVL
jgi:hypothetical protein